MTKEYRFIDLKLGLSESFKTNVTTEMMTQFMKLSGDNNPLHTDKDFAKSHGFDGPIVYGMLTSSFYSTLVGVYLPGKYCVLQGMDISFHGPVFSGEELNVVGEISYINEAYKQIEIKAYILNQQGKKISKAKIKVGINE